MEREPTIRRQRLLDCESRELVPKRHPIRCRDQHAGRQAFLKAINHAFGKRLEQPDLRLRGDDCGRLDQFPPLGRKTRGSGENCVAHGARNLLTASRQHLVDEERIAIRLQVEVFTVEAALFGELRDG